MITPPTITHPQVCPIEKSPVEIIENILSRVPNTEENKVESLARASRRMRFLALRKTKSKVTAVRLATQARNIKHAPANERLSEFTAILNEAENQYQRRSMDLVDLWDVLKPLALSLRQLTSTGEQGTGCNRLAALIDGLPNTPAKAEAAGALASANRHFHAGADRVAGFNSAAKIIDGLPDTPAKGVAAAALAGAIEYLPEGAEQVTGFNLAAAIIGGLSETLQKSMAAMRLAATIEHFPEEVELRAVCNLAAEIIGSLPASILKPQAISHVEYAIELLPVEVQDEVRRRLYQPRRT